MSNLDMARDKGGQGMKAPPVVKYRKNIGTYQRESTNKEVKRVYRDRADARKGKVPNKRNYPSEIEEKYF